MSTFDPDNFEPVHIGPTWERDESGFVLPKYSLGYNALRWTYEYLQAPGGGPWQYTPEQARYILWWYALDETGKFLFRDGTLQRLKGWGKDPIAGTMSAFELCGDCRFSHWDKDGKPVGKKPNEVWVQIAAVSKTQTQNTMSLFPSLFTKKAKSEYALKIGAEMIRAFDGEAKLESVTSSASTLEGNRPSFFLGNESHLWKKNNEGHAMANVARRNARKVGGRILYITNAPSPGQDSVAERVKRAYDDMQAGRIRSYGYLYDSLEAPADAPLTLEAAPKVLVKVRGDSTWLPIDELVAGILDPETSPSEARRFYYNQITASEDALITSTEWDQNLAPGEDLQPGDEIVLGLDPSKSDDSTALVAIRLSDRLIVPIHIWEVPRGEEGQGYEIDFSHVSGVIASTFATYRVRAFFSDVNPVQGWVDKWSDEYREVVLIKASPKSTVGLDMRGNQSEITHMNEALVGALREKTVKIRTGQPVDVILREHAMNAFQRPNQHGMSFGKESRESQRKVDGWASTLLAYIALNRYLESGRQPKEEQSGEFWIF